MLLTLLVACTRRAAVPPSTAAPPPADACVEACTQRRMAEAMGWEIIEQECRDECATQAAPWQILSATYPTTALQETAAWYQQVLGFEVTFALGVPGVARLTRTGTVLILREAETMAPGAVVLQVVDLDAMRTHLEGQLLAAPPTAGTWEGRPSLTLQAPDGSIVHLVGPTARQLR